jgi:hypothetical protein
VFGLYSECIDEDDAAFEHIVAVGYFVGGMPLPDLPGCGARPDGTLMICEWNPPTALRFIVTKQLYGSPIPSKVDTVTVDAVGLSDIDFNTQPYLVHLIRHAQEFSTPPYHRLRLAWDSEHQLALPIQHPEESIEWLPCSVSQKPGAIELVRPDEAVQFDFDPDHYDQLQEARDFVSVQGCKVRINRGIHVDEIARRLQGVTSAEMHAGCHIW